MTIQQSVRRHLSAAKDRVGICSRSACPRKARLRHALFASPNSLFYLRRLSDREAKTQLGVSTLLLSDVSLLRRRPSSTRCTLPGFQWRLSHLPSDRKSPHIVPTLSCSSALHEFGLLERRMAQEPTSSRNNCFEQSENTWGSREQCESMCA
ncbi:uncharacterized protein LOC111270923 [Varroa jacobsoni]|uniref:uncharacterized protein LOC111270923 n=1 Tax=Varroa jacobsoni TaxID=62625 RepID=UPI000BF99799|nr:uncharacterized protein LOC111270923 [Varroa jacobsoni]